jgi:hypothetical protein
VDVLSIADISPATLGTSVSLAAAGLALITQWRVFRTGGQHRFRDLEERCKAVTFWSAWAEAQKLVAGKGPSDERLARAQAALDELADFGDDSDPIGQALGVPTWGVRHLLLIEAPRKRATWPLQGFFYVAVAAGSAFVGVTLFDLRDNLTMARGGTFAGLVIAVLLILALMRQVVLLIDGKALPAPARRPAR